MHRIATTPQSIGGVLDSGFRLFRSSFKHIVLLGLVAGLGPLIAGLAAFFEGGEDEMLAGLAVLTASVFGVIMAGAIIARINAVAADQPMTFAEAFRVGLRRGPALILAGLCYALASAVGLVLLLVPGMFVMVALAFAPWAVVTENLGAIASLSYSRDLVRGHWWRTAALLTVSTIIVTVFYFVLGLIAGLVTAIGTVTGGATVAPFVQLALTPLLSAVLTPLLYALIAATYYDLKLRHEGGDIAERIAAASGSV